MLYLQIVLYCNINKTCIVLFCDLTRPEKRPKKSNFCKLSKIFKEVYYATVSTGKTTVTYIDIIGNKIIYYMLPFFCFLFLDRFLDRLLEDLFCLKYRSTCCLFTRTLQSIFPHSFWNFAYIVLGDLFLELLYIRQYHHVNSSVYRVHIVLFCFILRVLSLFS